MRGYSRAVSREGDGERKAPGLRRVRGVRDKGTRNSGWLCTMRCCLCGRLGQEEKRKTIGRYGRMVINHIHRMSSPLYL